MRPLNLEVVLADQAFYGFAARIVFEQVVLAAMLVWALNDKGHYWICKFCTNSDSRRMSSSVMP